MLKTAWFHILKNTQNWWKSPYYRLGVLLNFCHFCNVVKPVDSPSWAEQNGTNYIVVAWTVAEIFSAFRQLKKSFSWLPWTNNLTIEHDTTELITPFYSQSIALFNDIKYFIIFHNCKNTLIDLAFCRNFANFTRCSKHI